MSQEQPRRPRSDAQFVAAVPGGTQIQEKITIGEALEATAIRVEDKPITRSDAAAIQAAEAIITGGSEPAAGGLGAEAQAAASANELVSREELKTKLSDVLSNATRKLPGDKVVTRDDAERVIGAELRNNPERITRPGGVAASVAAAARLNEGGDEA